MPDKRHRGLGLRAQIMVALALLFLGSFSLLSVAAVQLSEHARAVDRVRDAQGVAEAWHKLRENASAYNEESVRALVSGGSIVGVRVRGPSADRRYGATTGEPQAVAGLPEAEQISLWVRRSEPRAAMPLTRLLLMYVGFTALAVLLFAYVALTHLIIRPVEALTHASERLAAGVQHVQVPVRGAAEIIRLSDSFNTMAAELRNEATARERRVQELEETTRALGRAQDQVLRSERLASVGRLSAGVAHEIGNPLAAILGFIELLRGGELAPSERDEFLRRIQAETERIHKIIRNLLDFARQQDGPVPESRADLCDVVENAVRLIAPQKDLRSITIERRLTEGAIVRGDADPLTQVVLNLLLNAADAVGGEGTIRVEVDARPGDRVSLVVADTGPGIDPAVLPNLFEPFVTTKPPGEGTGLGLAVCHTLVTRLGGPIVASNPPEGGARFEVLLPAASEATGDADSEEHKPANGRRPG